MSESPTRLRIYICEPGEGSFHRHISTVEMDGGKVTELKVADKDAPVVVQALNKIRIELAARTMVATPVKITHGLCGQCGGKEFHQPLAMSSVIECNRCGAQFHESTGGA